MLFLMSSLFAFTSIMPIDRNLPSCLFPIFIVYFLKLGASVIPLEEFPTTASIFSNKEKYIFCPKLSNNQQFFLVDINLKILECIYLFPASEFGWVKKIFISGKNFKALGRIGEAAKNFEIAFKIEPEDHLGANLQLASLGKKKIPKKTPENYLNHFYKNKSKIWNNLESKIYHGKKLIEDAFSQNHNKQNKIEILDLGCGTGSLASFLRPYAKILVAVDLSLAMLNEAEKTGIYDQLYNKDLEQYLSEISNNYDAIVAAAVMIHFYDLDNIFSLIRESLKQNGKFVFSVFEAKKKDRELNSFLMYSHSEKYIASLAKRYKFRINYQQKEIHEYDNEIPANALIYVLQKSS